MFYIDPYLPYYILVVHYQDDDFIYTDVLSVLDSAMDEEDLAFPISDDLESISPLEAEAMLKNRLDSDFPNNWLH